MNYQGYGEHITQSIKDFPYGIAIFSDQVARLLVEQFSMPLEQARKITNVNLNRMADKEEIERLQKGIYYRAKQTVFGKTKPNMDVVMEQLMTQKDDEVIGYETGAAFFHRIGLTTLMPRCKEIATNSFRRKVEENCHIIAKKPVTEINKKNYRYLQYVDMIDQLPNAYVDAENPKQILLGWLHKEELDKEHLIYYARKYYSKNTLLRLIDTILEVENETA